MQTGMTLKQPPMVSIPPFREFSQPIEKSLTVLQTKKHDLKQVAEARRSGQTIMSDLGEALALGEVLLPYTSYLLDWPGYALGATAILAVAALIVCVYLILRIRKLAAAVAALQQVSVATAQLQLEYGKHQVAVSETINGTAAGVGQVIIELTTKSGPLAVVIVLLGALLLLITYKLLRKHWKKITMTTKSILAIELISNQSNLIVQLKQFRGDPEGYIVKYDQKVIQSVRVQGTCFPLLLVSWSKTRVVDTLTAKEANLNGAFRVSGITAILARKILKRMHAYRLVWITDDKKVKEPVLQRDDPSQVNRSEVGSGQTSRIYLYDEEGNDQFNRGGHKEGRMYPALPSCP